MNTNYSTVKNIIERFITVMKASSDMMNMGAKAVEEFTPEELAISESLNTADTYIEFMQANPKETVADSDFWIESLSLLNKETLRLVGDEMSGSLRPMLDDNENTILMALTQLSHNECMQACN
jgi:hypothetical protein